MRTPPQPADGQQTRGRNRERGKDVRRVHHRQRCEAYRYLREALSVWLTVENEINYSAQDKDILTAIGYRPDAPSRDDNREKFTPAQNMIYTRRRAELAAQ